MTKMRKRLFVAIATFGILLILSACTTLGEIKISLDATYEVTEGQTIEIAPLVTKDGAEYQTALGYVSLDTSIAKFVDGKLTGVKPGQVRIKVYVVEQPKAYATALVTVTDNNLLSATFDIEQEMNVNEIQQIHYQIIGTELQPLISYHSSNEQILTVDENGTIVAKSEGSATVIIRLTSVNDPSIYREYKYEIKISYYTYSIEYVLNGGKNHKDNPKGVHINQLPITLYEPTKAGYNFVGWYDNAEFTNQPIILIEQMENEQIQLFAKWEKIDYTIEYNLNGGTNHSDNPFVYNIETDTITLSPATKAYYTFDGWYIGDIKVETIQKGTIGNQTLTAKYTPIEYTIRYNLDGGMTTNQNNYTIESETIVLSDAVKANYLFIGWFDSENHQVTEIPTGTTGNIELIAYYVAIDYTIEYVLNGGLNQENNPSKYNVETNDILLLSPSKKGYTFLGWFNENNERVTVIKSGSAGNIILVANWEADTYTVTFDSNGGASVDSIEYTIESEDITFTASEKTGYTFLGWFNENNEEITGIKTGSVGDITLVANWEADTYKIVLDANGGTGVEDIEFTVESSAIELPTTSKSGYTFLGWYDENDELVTTIEAGTVGNLTLKAKYQLITYTIQYDGLNDGDNVNNPTEYTIESGSIVLQNPILVSGYIFEGWYDENDELVTTIESETNRNLVVTAKLREYTIQEVKETTKETAVFTGTITAISVLSSQYNNFSVLVNDGTASIMVYRISNATYAYDQFALGQKIKVKGQNVPYNGLNEIATIDSIEIIEEGVSLQPVELEVIPSEEELLALQCSVVKMTLTFVSGTLGVKQNAIFRDTNGNQITLRGDSDWGTIDSMTLRVGGQYTIVGFVSWYNGPQISNSSNYPFVEAVVNDETIAMDYLDQIQIESTATENFDLPSLEGITWSMKETTAAELVGGTVNIIRGEADIVITLVATYILNGKGYDKAFDVVVKKQSSGNEEWTLVTNESDLNVGDTIVIVAKDSDVALSTTQDKNNRKQTNITKSENIVAIDNTVQILTLTAGTKEGTFGFDTSSGYLYAASSSSNYLRTEQTLSDNSSWKITIDETGVAKVVAQGSNTRNLLKYNSTSSIFSCYSSGQKDISIYKLTASTPLTDEQMAQKYLNNLSVVNETSLDITLAQDENLSWQLNTVTDVANIVDGVLVVTPGDTDVTITLVAIYTLNGQSYDREFEIVVKKKDDATKIEKTYTYQFVSGALKTAGGSAILGEINWSYGTLSFVGFDASKGIQVGSSNNPTNSLVLSTSAINGNIKSIVINASIAKSGTAKLSVSIGGINYLNAQALTTTATDYTILPNASGDISISFTNTAKAFYIKSITIVYEE
ncbi:MAG: InlB B-repeat-containing protein [Prevotella sp.]|nr:InlB B-repeat-containing protein [Prevotella sp.]